MKVWVNSWVVESQGLGKVSLGCDDILWVQRVDSQAGPHGSGKIDSFKMEQLSCSYEHPINIYLNTDVSGPGLAIYGLQAKFGHSLLFGA